MILHQRHRVDNVQIECFSFDNTSYLTGDTVWFKAYVANASDFTASKSPDYTERRSIKSRQAKKLISSVESTLAYADVPKKAANTAGSNGSGIAIPLYDGNTAYAVSPDKAVYFWTGSSEDVPDETWQEEYLKFK